MKTPEEEQSLAFGGQALIEGVMMRSGTHMVMCVRQNEESIVTETVALNSLTARYKMLGLPFIRGIIMLFEMMYYGVKGIFFSANVALEEEEEEPFTWKEYLLVIVLVILMNGFFMIVPFLLTNFLHLSGVLFNIVESLLRLSLFGLYMYLISRWEEFSRILMYHGAEHKTINAFEAGASMDAETVATYPRTNPRCGTSFLFLVIVTSIIIYSLIPKTTFYMRIAYRIFLIPVIASLSYELLKFSDKHRNSSIMRLIMGPGLLFQKLTTKEPDNDMIEVAVKALEEVKRLNQPD
jgi:uncharacterized protein YqhQ